MCCTAAVLLCGCATSSGAAAKGTATPEEGVSLNSYYGGSPCPAKYGDPGPACAGREGAFTVSCKYPEGDCYCGDEPVCSGVEQPPMPAKWVCVPKRPACPALGTSCEGQAVCAPWCCGMGTVCKDGKWQAQMFECPP